MTNTLQPGTIVLSQDGEAHRGVVLAAKHQLDGWVWVGWEHIGVADELIADLVIKEDQS